MFKMKKYESIFDMLFKLTNIINALNGLGKIDTNYELVCKVLRSLPKKWKTKVTAIWEAKDLTKLSLEELIDLLITHKLNMTQKEEEEEPKKMKTIVFKFIAHDEESNDSEEEEDEKESEDDEDMASLTRKFKKFLIKKSMKKKKNK